VAGEEMREMVRGVVSDVVRDVVTRGQRIRLELPGSVPALTDGHRNRSIVA
jgi:hypothetical protein